MKTTASFKRGLAQVKREWQAGRYDRALSAVNRLLDDWPDNPRLLVAWADLVQLQDGANGPTLDEAKAAYQRSADLDDQSPAALTELGHFLYAVEDDAKAADQVFAKAAALSRRQLREALLARTKALLELGRKAEAFGCLREAIALEAFNGKPRDGSEAELLDRLKDLGRAD